MKMAKKIILSFIVFYQKVISANWGIFGFINTSCKFYPSCSEYGYGAIDKLGVKRGLVLSFKRILRCHPLSKGGCDDIPGI